MTANNPNANAKSKKRTPSARQLRLPEIEMFMEDGLSARHIATRMRISLSEAQLDMDMVLLRQRLKGLHDQKLDGGEIAAQLGVSRQRVWQLRKSLGLSRPHSARKKRLPIVAALVKQGLRPTEIAAQLGVLRSLIGNDMLALGLKAKTHTEQREEEIRRLIAAGKNRAAIGRALSLSPVTIRNDCRKLGLTRLLDANK